VRSGGGEDKAAREQTKAKNEALSGEGEQKSSGHTERGEVETKREGGKGVGDAERKCIARAEHLRPREMQAHAVLCISQSGRIHVEAVHLSEQDAETALQEAPGAREAVPRLLHALADGVGRERTDCDELL